MPRVSKQQSQVNRAAILEVSSRLFRERGLNGVSVADLMAAAGLTHGGFYGHFESKDALAAEACSKAFAASVERWEKRVASSTGVSTARTAIIEAFLTVEARNSPGYSCATATLAGDVARQAVDAPIRAAFASGLEDLLQILEPLGGDALADLATLVGAQILARATSQSAISEEILTAARRRLLVAKASS